MAHYFILKFKMKKDNNSEKVSFLFFSFLLSPPCPAAGTIAGLFAELSGDMRISASKVRVLCSAQKARVYSGGVWAMPQARYVRPSAPLSDVSQGAKSEQFKLSKGSFAFV